MTRLWTGRDRALPDALQRPLGDSGARFSSGVVKSPSGPPKPLRESFKAATGRSAAFPQVRLLQRSVLGGRANQSMSKVGGMTLGMHQSASPEDQ